MSQNTLVLETTHFSKNELAEAFDFYILKEVFINANNIIKICSVVLKWKLVEMKIYFKN